MADTTENFRVNHAVYLLERKELIINNPRGWAAYHDGRRIALEKEYDVTYKKARAIVPKGYLLLEHLLEFKTTS